MLAITVWIIIATTPAWSQQQLQGQNGAIIGEIVPGGFYIEFKDTVRVNFAGLILVADFGAPTVGPGGAVGLSRGFGLATEQGTGFNTRHGASRLVFFDVSTDCTGTDGVFVIDEGWTAFGQAVPGFVVAPATSEPNRMAIYQITGPLSTVLALSNLNVDATPSAMDFDHDTGELKTRVKCDFPSAASGPAYPAREVVVLPRYSLPFSVAGIIDDDADDESDDESDATDR